MAPAQQDRIQPYFRPTLVVFVEKAGQAVGAQLEQLLAEVDEARRTGIALLTVTGEANGAFSGGWFGAQRAAASTAQGQPADRLPLGDLIMEALKGQAAGHIPLLDPQLVQRVKAEGYVVIDDSVVVWVVAETQSPLLAPIVKEIHETLTARAIKNEIFLGLLKAEPTETQKYRAQMKAIGDQPWDYLLGTSPGHKRLATFAYHFESRDEEGRFWNETDIYFAAAEALFFCFATPITETTPFQETLRIGQYQRGTFACDRMGSIGVSRLTFPRAQAELYCANQLGARIMARWQSAGRDDALDASQSQAQERSAKEFFRKTIEEAVQANKQRAQRAGSLKRPAPPLNQQTLTRLTGAMGPPSEENEPIFRYFSSLALRRPMLRRQGLPRVLKDQSGQAQQDFERWRKLNRGVWDEFASRTQDEISRQANELIFQRGARDAVTGNATDQGVARARVYVQQIRQRLTTYRDDLVEERRQRGEDYSQHLAKLYSLGEGEEWEDEIPPDDPTAQIGPNQSAAPIPWNGANPAAPTPPAMQAPQGAPAGQRSREEEIGLRLGTRYEWLQRRMPSAPTLVGASLLVVPVGFFLGQALLAAGGLNSFALLAGVLLCGAVPWGLYRLLKALQIRKARKTLRHFYLRFFAHRCEEEEDESRDIVIYRLLMRARRMMERLADWERFIAELAERLERRAREIQEELFTGAIGRRDMLIANTQQLRQGRSRQDRYDLRDFEEDVNTERRGPKSLQPWHGDDVQELRHLLQDLQGHTTLLNAPEDELIDPIREFCRRELVRPYFRGDLVSVTAALKVMPPKNADDLYQELLGRSIILYHPDESPRPSSFIAGRDDHFVYIKVPPNGAKTLPSQSEEWAATLRLMPGGGIPAFLAPGDPGSQDPPIRESPDWVEPDPGQAPPAWPPLEEDDPLAAAQAQPGSPPPDEDDPLGNAQAQPGSPPLDEGPEWVNQAQPGSPPLEDDDLLGTPPMAPETGLPPLDEEDHPGNQASEQIAPEPGNLAENEHLE